MKKTIVVLAMLAIVSTGLFAGSKEFQKGGLYLTAQLGMNSFATPFGASVEYGVTENIGVGGTVMFQFWSDDYGWYGYSSTLITPSIDAAYHFTKLDVEKLDLFAGASLGYSVYSWKWKTDGHGSDSGFGKSSLYLSPFIAARYYISKKIAISAKANFSAIGDFDGIGGTIGVTFPL